MSDLKIVIADFDENRKDYQIQQLKQQLEDAFEVMNTIERMEEDEEYPATRISKAAKMCRQFIEKYRREK